MNGVAMDKCLLLKEEFFSLIKGGFYNKSLKN
jgi:hypothetical protein